MSSNRKVKGAIFRVDCFEHACYYDAYHRGMTRNRADAYVYTEEEIHKYKEHDTWADKKDGTWVLVYE